MSNELIANERVLREGVVTERFLETPSEESFADLFKRTRRLLPDAQLRTGLG
jgi:hypothetical protein